MNFILGVAGKVPEAKFTKSLNKKKYSYIGEETDCVFIEEFIYNALIKNNINFKNKELQVIITFSNKIYFISLNDANDMDGEFGLDTIEYNKSEFSEDDIFNFLSDYIIDFENIIFVETESETTDDNAIFTFINEKDNLNFEIEEQDVDCEILRTNSKKIKMFLTNNIFIIYPILLITIIPYVSKPKLDELISNKSVIITKLNTETRKLKKLELSKFKELNETREKLKNLKLEKNVFEDLNKMKKFLLLKNKLKD